MEASGFLPIQDDPQGSSATIGLPGARRQVGFRALGGAGTPKPLPTAVRLSGTKSITIPLIKQQLPLEETADNAGVTVGTVANHLAELIQTEPVDSIDAWVPRDIQNRVLAAADVVSRENDVVGREKLGPIYEHVQQQMGYDTIRIVLAFERQNAAASDASR